MLLLTWTFNDYHCVGVCFPPGRCSTWFKIHNTQDAYKLMILSTLINMATREGLCATRISARASCESPHWLFTTACEEGKLSIRRGQWPATSTQVRGCRTGIRTQVFLPPKLIASALGCFSLRIWVCTPVQCWPEPGFNKYLSWFLSSWKRLCRHLTRRATRNQLTQATATLPLPAQAQCILLTRL